jgi:RNA polymerase sigma-70 factor (ECF subfamily)
VPDEGDDGLIARIAAGDDDAFAAFVHRHQDGVYRYLVARTRSASAADDALQETFVAVWRGAAAFRAEGSARGWLFGLARRQAARTFRRRVGEPADHDGVEAIDVVGWSAGWGTGDPERALAAAESKERLLRALATLSDEDREVVELRDLAGLDGAAVAEALGVGLLAMKSRLHRARLRLMAALRADSEVADG